MRRPFEEETLFDAASLMAASASEKDAMLGAVIDGMINGQYIAGNTAFWLGHNLADDQAISAYSPVDYDTDTAHGNMQPKNSLNFLRGTERLKGYLGAIRRWDQQQAVLDVGSGPFPVMALAAAVFHPKAEVVAAEIHPQAAHRAETIINAFGLSDRVTVVNSDVATLAIDSNTTGAVTETFNAGLSFEPGPRIVRLLDQAGIPTITPSWAKLWLDIDGDNFYNWVDLRTDTHGKVEFGYPNDSRHASLSAAFYDDKGLVLDYGDDIITSRVSVSGRLALSDPLPKDSKSQLIYELGCREFSPKFEAAETASSL